MKGSGVIDARHCLESLLTWCENFECLNFNTFNFKDHFSRHSGMKSFLSAFRISENTFQFITVQPVLRNHLCAFSSCHYTEKYFVCAFFIVCYHPTLTELLFQLPLIVLYVLLMITSWTYIFPNKSILLLVYTKHVYRTESSFYKDCIHF